MKGGGGLDASMLLSLGDVKIEFPLAEPDDRKLSKEFTALGAEPRPRP